MTVKLSERAEQIVREQVKAGLYSSADEAVNRIMEEILGADDFVEPAVEAALLKALDSPRHAFDPEKFMERARQRASEKVAG